ncbi:pollen-specific leucine-rich repeat extensin-like protein 1 [Schistocerca americana]|uniref:pollen-specific leucine-rich repeat extensin-like protein 1 n=1 Tax=Schistocerca americana TaxID=7009 RepID=UPI001F4FFC07|nr:pollen-specific leucine-rich repeat extensin-like protein 1 [Schistocerca americana]
MAGHRRSEVLYLCRVLVLPQCPEPQVFSESQTPSLHVTVSTWAWRHTAAVTLLRRLVYLREPSDNGVKPPAMEKQAGRVRKEAAPAVEEAQRQQQSQEARDLPGPSREGRDPAAGDQESGAELEGLPAAASESPALEKAGTSGLERGISPDSSPEEQEEPPRKKSASPERSLERAEGASSSCQQEGGQQPLPDEPSLEGQEQPPRKKSASPECSLEQAEGTSTSSQQQEGEGQQTLPDGSKKRAFTLESRLQGAVKKRLLRRQLSTPESSSSPASEGQEGSDDGSSRDLSLHEESSGDTRDVRGRLKQLKIAAPKPQTSQGPPQTSAPPSPQTSPAQPQPLTSAPPSPPTSPAQPQQPTSPAQPTSPPSPTVSDAMREMFSPGTSDEIWSARNTAEAYALEFLDGQIVGTV